MIKNIIKEIKSKRSILLKFIIVGFVGFLVNYTAFAILAYTINASKQLSELFAIIIAIHITFYLNNLWTYRQNIYNTLLSRYYKYMASNAIAALITYAIFVILIYIFHHSKLIDLLALIVSSGAGMIWNYIMNTYFIWSEKKSSP